MPDDLDAELLALAGDASDEEASPPTRQKRDSFPASSSPRSPGPSAADRRSAAKSSRRGKKYTDDEDGELSDADSHNSLQSASMSESNSVASDSSPLPIENDGPLFAYDNLFHSPADKSHIMGLPEIQREEILSERSQQVERHSQDIALRRLFSSRERAEKKGKRKAGDAALDDGQRKSSRQKTTLGGRKVGETSGAMAAYKRQREQKGKRDERRRRDPVAKDQKAKAKADGLSDKDATDESEADFDDQRSPSAPKDDPPADLRDLQRARVGRSNFAQVCFYPGFDEAISGCYTRLSVGPHRDTGENVYRVALIKKFVEGRPYAMEGANGRSFVTTQYALLAHGKAEREFPFIACSDSPFTEAEFHRYRQTMAIEDCKMATKSQLVKKVTDINRLLNHQFTKEELNEKLRKQGTLDNKMHVFKLMETQRKLQAARSAGDEEEIAKMEEAMKEFETPKLAFGTTLHKPRSEQKTSQERIHELNLRNQKLDHENIRRVQLEERKAARKAAAAIARGEMPADPFKRVRTNVRTFYDPNPASSKEESGTSDPSRNATPMTTESPGKPGTPQSTTPSTSQKTDAAKSDAGTSQLRYTSGKDADAARMMAICMEMDINIDEL